MAVKEYIERGKINDYISKLREYVSASVGLSQAEYSFISDILTAFENFPAADVAPVKHGHWIEIDHSENFGDYHFVCSECKCNTPDRAYVVAPDFCPNCGARMDGGEEND